MNDQTTLILVGVALVILILLGIVAMQVTKRVRQANATIPPPGAMTPAGPPQAQGFISGLFDFSFTTFITTRIIKVLYALYMIGVVFGAVAGVGAGVVTMSTSLVAPTETVSSRPTAPRLDDTDDDESMRGPRRGGPISAAPASPHAVASASPVGLVTGAVMIATTLLFALMALIFGRVLFEMVVVFFRIAEHLSELNRKAKE